MINNGHRVLVERGAGEGSGFRDEDYVRSGCEVVPNAAAVYSASDMIVKVKEPLRSEYELIRENQTVFTYFHFASSPELTDAMIKSKAVCIAYETVAKNGQLPLLVPMSEIAGRMAIQCGAKFLEKPMGGRGVLLGGVPGVTKGQVLVLGGGIVGTEAAKMAAGLGAQVTIMDVNLERLRYLDTVMPANVCTRFSSPANIEELLPHADLVVSAVLLPGMRAPLLVRREHLSTMKAGAVITDVAVDQGGCIETCKPTTHEAPTFTVDGVVHYCVANMPGAVPFSSTQALNNATLPYALHLANLGWANACSIHADLRQGLNIAKGTVVHPGVHADYPLYPFTDVDKFLAQEDFHTPLNGLSALSTFANGSDRHSSAPTVGARAFSTSAKPA